MKISEKLAELKQKESELMRLFELKDNVFVSEFDSTTINKEKTTNKELEKKYEEFVNHKVEKIRGLDAQIDKLKSEIIEGKNKINKKNIENGVDKKLLEIKYDRIELSKLMKLAKGQVSYRPQKLEFVEQSGINKRIKELETKKNKLDAEIQHNNWSQNL